jgi:hypothetical protein
MNNVAFVWVAICFLAAPSYANIINDVSGLPEIANIDRDPFAQTFTPTGGDINVQAVSFLWARTLVAGQTDIIEADLRDGGTLNGPVIGSQTVSVTPPNIGFSNTWIGFVFDNSVSLIAGQTYTVTFKKLNTSLPADGSYAVTRNTYSGGTLLVPAIPFPDPRDPGEPSPRFDLAFRVFATPEPSTTALVFAGLFGCVLNCRRRPTSHSRI